MRKGSRLIAVGNTGLPSFGPGRTGSIAAPRDHASPFRFAANCRMTDPIATRSAYRPAPPAHALLRNDWSATRMSREPRFPSLRMIWSLTTRTHRFTQRQSEPELRNRQQERCYARVSRAGSSADTIFALSSASGRSAVAVLRVSGRHTQQIVHKITRREVPHPRLAALRKLFHPKTGELLDTGLVLWFPGPNSYTGEDMAEFHTHGGPAVVTAMLDAFPALPELRSAEPGEFTRRALENGKVDLTEAEGIADIIKAETEGQRRQALAQMGGALRSLCNSWREELISCLAHVEAVIDFGEDEEIDFKVASAVQPRLQQIVEEMKRHLKDAHRGERMRNGASLAIVGPPNAGKSSLLNLLARRKAAIVSHIPGTTRDVIEVALDIAGYPVVVADTAGLRDTTDEIEREGVQLARERFKSADVKILVIDGTMSQQETRAALENLADEDTICVVNKSDLVSDSNDIQLPGIPRERQVPISCKTGLGIDVLTQQLEQLIKNFFVTGSGESATITRARQREHLEHCVKRLDRYLELAQEAASSPTGTMPIEIAAEELRRALADIGRLTGQVDLEEVFDVLFRDFCIGK